MTPEERRQRRRAKQQQSVKCQDCENAIFDELWGERKCKVKMRKVTSADTSAGCLDFKKKTTKQ